MKSLRHNRYWTAPGGADPGHFTVRARAIDVAGSGDPPPPPFAGGWPCSKHGHEREQGQHRTSGPYKTTDQEAPHVLRDETPGVTAVVEVTAAHGDPPADRCPSHPEEILGHCCGAAGGAGGGGGPRA